MELIDVDSKEFKKIIYPEYIKLFPALERKSYRQIKKTMKKDICCVTKIVEKNKLVGFMIVNTLGKNALVQLDYLAILENYQHKGYGTQAIKLLKKKYQANEAILIEVEKLGLGKNQEENSIREKRIKFYEKLGFYKMNFDLDLFKVIYSIYVLPISEKNFSEEEILKEIFEIYHAVAGKRKIQKYCKIVKR